MLEIVVVDEEDDDEEDEDDVVVVDAGADGAGDFFGFSRSLSGISSKCGDS